MELLLEKRFKRMIARGQKKYVANNVSPTLFPRPTNGRPSFSTAIDPAQLRRRRSVLITPSAITPRVGANPVSVFV